MHYRALVLTAVVLMMGCNSKPKTASLSALNETQLSLTLPWNGSVVKAEPPATIPQSILSSAEYKKWERIGDTRAFVGKDASENSVHVTVAGIGIDNDGVRRPVIPSIKVFSPDDTLINETAYWVNGYPLKWDTYSPDGHLSQKVSASFTKDTQQPFIRSITVKNKNSFHRYESKGPKNVAWIEKEVDLDGNTIRIIQEE